MKEIKEIPIIYINDDTKKRIDIDNNYIYNFIGRPVDNQIIAFADYVMKLKNANTFYNTTVRECFKKEASINTSVRKIYNAYNNGLNKLQMVISKTNKENNQYLLGYYEAYQEVLKILGIKDERECFPETSDTRAKK